MGRPMNRRKFLQGMGALGVATAAAGPLAGCASPALQAGSTATPIPPGATAIPPTSAPAATATMVPPTATSMPPTATTVPPVTSAPTTAATPAAVPAAGSAPIASAIKWDREADIVILGTGSVLTAALAAHDAGAEVLILEKANYAGGTTSVSGGALWIPNNYVMKQAGISDSREEAIKYVTRVTDGNSYPELIESYVDNGPVMVEWLRDKCGFEWEPGGWSVTDQTMSVFTDYMAEWEGGKRRGRNIGVKAAQGQGGGAALTAALLKALADRNITPVLNTPGKRLMTNEQGEVIGVVAESGGQEINVKARKGVIIGTGGFDHNKDMTQHFLRVPIYFSCSVPANTGDGHLMGMDLGADLRNMNSVFGFVGYNVNPDARTGAEDWSLWRGKPGTIIVNKWGERFCDEAGPYNYIYRSFGAWDNYHFEWRNIPSFIIVDSDYYKHYPMPGTFTPNTVPPFMKQSDTLHGLADALGIVDVDKFLQTMERFNANAKNGVDPDWGRGTTNFDQFTPGDRTRTDIKNPNLAPLGTPPFYGTTIWPGALATNGGLRTNGNAQVLHVFGHVIPRLYASGSAMASAMGTGYPGGGGTIGPGTVFAWLAGRHAAALSSWESGTAAPTGSTTPQATTAASPQATVAATTAATTAPTAAATSAPTAAATTSASAGGVTVQIDAAQLEQTVCTQCHTLDRIQAKHQDQAGWTQTIDRMRVHGAPLTDEQAAALAEYLAKVQGQ